MCEKIDRIENQLGHVVNEQARTMVELGQVTKSVQQKRSLNSGFTSLFKVNTNGDKKAETVTASGSHAE